MINVSNFTDGGRKFLIQKLFYYFCKYPPLAKKTVDNILISDNNKIG